MKIKSVSYGRLKKRPEPFENERSEVTIELEPGDDVLDAQRRARALVNRELGERPSVSAYERARAIIAEFDALALDEGQ